MGQKEREFFEIVAALGFRLEVRSFPWLANKLEPGEPKHAVLWRIFESLDGDVAGMRNKAGRSLKPDGYLARENCIIEFDEVQHFTPARATSLQSYPHDFALGFDRSSYLKYCHLHRNTAEGKGASGYRAPKKEFPFAGGRLAQRALFDACRDLLPPLNDLRPTIRIAEFDVPSLGSKDRSKAEGEVWAVLKNRLK